MLLAFNNKNAIAQDLADTELSTFGLLIDGCIGEDVI
jgi:hypothetical protein